ncbi:MAG: deoxyguanosinetriphosphate triphosphohydrolase, partial [Acidobacteriota bacterium]
RRGITHEVHSEGNADGLERTLAAMGEVERGLVFVNLVDFDMLYGHRNDPAGYYGCLREFDAFLPRLEDKLRPGDLLVLTADHGNDPSTTSTDHSREYVPLLVYGAQVRPGADLGVRDTFADLGQTLADIFGVGPLPNGRSFLGDFVAPRRSPVLASIREDLERREQLTLAPLAAKSVATRGRLRPEPEDQIRPAFQRDRDRIVHCKAFRRLKHKTQVFFAPAGDHYRTRLTHTLEVSQIARTIAKVLSLHEELTEAIALGHDLGHTPFGHQGERVLNDLMPGGFEHYEQSLRIVNVLERDGEGLNLTWEVREGIGKHSKGKQGAPVGPDVDNRPSTLEGQIARVADLIAYVNHDIDDAVRAGILKQDWLPAAPLAVLGHTHSARIGCMVGDVVTETLAGGLDVIRMSDPVLEALLDLRRFMFSAVYENDRSTAEFKKAAGILEGLWEKVQERPEQFLDRRTLDAEGLDAAARDFLAGMTDRYAVALYEHLFIPKPWIDLAGRWKDSGD